MSFTVTTSAVGFRDRPQNTEDDRGDVRTLMSEFHPGLDMLVGKEV
jgi:hypothetical protein